MNALYWWIDRWRKSSAFMDMTLEEQGAYRNLLDECTLRNGALPDDSRILARASGDPTRWKILKKVVMRRFFKARDGWHNETLDKVLKESERRRDKQLAYRARIAGNADSNGARNKTGSPDQDLISTYPPNPPKRGGRPRRRRKDVAAGSGNCPHTPRCRTRNACIHKTLAKKARH